MILFVTSTEHRYTHEDVEAEGDEIDAKVVSYDALIEGARDARVATYVFTDFERLSPSRLIQASRLYRAFKARGWRVINDPARVSSRFGLLRRLHRLGINDFDAYRVEELVTPRRWPVFLRSEGTHAAPVSALLNDAEELRRATSKAVASGIPLASLLIVEYRAEPVRPGLFRRLSVFRVGDRLLGCSCAHDDNWIVKYGKTGIAPPELYEEEYSLVRDNPFADALRAAFDAGGIDYGRADFGLIEGTPRIYEINTNPHLEFKLEPHPVPRRNESTALFRTNYLDALRAVDTPGE